MCIEIRLRLEFRPVNHLATQLHNSSSKTHSLTCSRWCVTYRVVCGPKIKSGRLMTHTALHYAHKMPCTTHASMHSAPLRKKSDALRSSARSGYLMRRLRHAVSRPCDAICAVLEPSAVLRVVRCGRCCSHIRFCDELIADALSPLPRDCGASAHQLAAADAPCAASGADAFGCHTVALVLFPEAAAPASASPASRFALAVGQGTCLPGHGASVGSVSRQARRLT